MSPIAAPHTYAARAGLALTLLLALSIPLAAQGNFAGRTERPLRYRPEGTDFLTENGAEFFNRPLYGTNTAFRRPEPIPPRVDLRSGLVRVLGPSEFKGKGGRVEGGAANVLDPPLRAEKELKTLTVRTLSNEVVTGLSAATLAR